jgi:hypothetical protein
MSDMLTREDLEAQIISRALRDEDYRQRLITDPKTVIVEELSQIEGDISISDEIEVEVLAETPHKRYLVLPASPTLEDETLSDDELAAVAGGAADKDSSCCCMRSTRQNTIDSTASFTGARNVGAVSIFGSFSTSKRQ